MLSPLHDLVAPEKLALVMFDLDGTLVDSVGDLKLALDHMYQDVQMAPASLAQVRSWVGNGARVLVQRALSYDLNPADSPLFDQAYARFLSHYKRINGSSSQCYEGAHDLIESLKACQIHVAVVTNKPIEFTLPLLKSMALEVDFVLGGDSLKEKKPSPLPLLECLGQFGCEAGQAIMIGDSLNDVVAAQQASVKCVAVTYGYNHGVSISDSNPDLLVDSLLELR